MILGRCQNHQNWSFKRPYQPNESWFEKCFYAKINTTLLLYLYQPSIFLLGHLHFFLHFFFLFMENLFKKHPISRRTLAHEVCTHFFRFMTTDIASYTGLGWCLKITEDASNGNQKSSLQRSQRTVLLFFLNLRIIAWRSHADSRVMTMLAHRSGIQASLHGSEQCGERQSLV